MAQELDDREFWLPSGFLTDDDLLTDSKTNRFSNNGTDAFLYYGTATKFGFMSSPVESVVGSTETESDEVDFITGLTRKIANSTLQDSSFSSDYTAKGQRLSSSPQSTLYGCKPESGRSSPNCVSQVSSPPDAKDTARWNFLCAAAEEVATMRMMDETSAFSSNSLYGPTHKHKQVGGGPVKNPIPLTGLYPIQAHARLSYHQLQATQFQLMKQQEMKKNSGVWAQENIGYQFQNGMRNSGGIPGPSLIPSRPTLQQSEQMQQRPGAGMRAVSLGKTGARKERTGTGVFLPRRFESNNPTDSRKKLGCSVLLPDKVVHALNLNFDSMDSSSQHRKPTAEHAGADFHHGNHVKFGQQMKSLRQTQQQVVKQELGLPQEWTY